MVRIQRARRVLRGISYASLSVAGVALTFAPTQSVKSSLGIVVYLWTVFLALGGLSSLIGTWTGRWIGEFAGLPMAASTMGVYATIIMFSGEFNWVKFGFGMIMLGRHPGARGSSQEGGREQEHD
jgi:hypothetical protein